MRNRPPQKVAVYNPLLKNLLVTYDLHGTGQPVEIVVPAMEIAYYPPFLADFIKKKLADLIINERGFPKGKPFTDAYEEIYKELTP